MNAQNDASRHGSHEDVFALVMGTLFVAFGMLICAKAQLLTGGLAGVALLLQYVTGTGFWIFFALVNLPFFVFAPKVLGSIEKGAKRIEVTISIGIATLETKGEPVNAVLKRADQALYRAKHDGRNRVVAAAA